MENNSEPILITKPLSPSKDEVFQLWNRVMDSGWLTNMGEQHNKFEQELIEFLGVSNISIFNNGTLALMVALKALDLPPGSEVITTPFTFAATPHSIAWNGLKPVFADIDPKTMTLSPQAIEKAITPRTSAIVAVHVYGFPCDVKAIDEIARKHQLRVVYDGAHAFSTKINGRSICEWGDITMLSFHATKLFNSIEGGALVFKDPDLGKAIYELRNFGIKKLTDPKVIQEGIKTSDFIDSIGINGKMNEFQAAWGRAVLGRVQQEQEDRGKVFQIYMEYLSGLPGLSIPQMPEDTTNSMQYFPVIFDPKVSGISRDDAHQALLKNNIFSRKYFYPLCSDFGCYSDYPSSQKSNLPVSHSIADNILCLPFYSQLLQNSNIQRVCRTLRNFFEKSAMNVRNI